MAEVAWLLSARHAPPPGSAAETPAGHTVRGLVVAWWLALAALVGFAGWLVSIREIGRIVIEVLWQIVVPAIVVCLLGAATTAYAYDRMMTGDRRRDPVAVGAAGGALVVGGAGLWLLVPSGSVPAMYYALLSAAGLLALGGLVGLGLLAVSADR